MAAPKGHPRYGGRQKGTRNVATEEAQAIAERLGFKPLEILAHFAMNNWEALGYTSPDKEISIGDGKTLVVDRIDEQLRQKSAKDAMPYIYPQLKAVELTGEAAANAFNSFASMVASLTNAKNDKEENHS